MMAAEGGGGGGGCLLHSMDQRAEDHLYHTSSRRNNHKCDLLTCTGHEHMGQLFIDKVNVHLNTKDT